MSTVTKTTGNYELHFLPPTRAYEMALILDQIELVSERISALEYPDSEDKPM